MPDKVKKSIRRTTIIYWILLLYIIAALVWWFISLQNQNKQITELKYQVIQQEKVQVIPSQTISEYDIVKNQELRNQKKYIGEGIAFLLLILVGAGFIFRSVRRQLKFQQQQQNFMMAVTHELKTPISVARLNLETLQKHQLDPEKQKKLIKMTLDETARLNSLTNNILISSQLEGGGYSRSQEELDLSDLFKDRVHDFTRRFPERKFEEEINPDIDIKGDPLLLQLLINNLLENALKYSPKDKPIRCVLQKENGLIKLKIIDEGSGVPDNEKQKIFTKFYRIGNESTRKTQGTGLGLYLCMKIAQDHNADIHVTNHLPQGSIFAVAFK